MADSLGLDDHLCGLV